MKTERYFLAGLLILLAGILLMYGGHNRPAFQTPPEKAGQRTGGAPAAALPRHTGGAHQ
jgi:hypothetical protein